MANLSFSSKQGPTPRGKKLDWLTKNEIPSNRTPASRGGKRLLGFTESSYKALPHWGKRIAGVTEEEGKRNVDEGPWSD